MPLTITKTWKCDGCGAEGNGDPALPRGNKCFCVDCVASRDDVLAHPEMLAALKKERDERSAKASETATTPAPGIVARLEARIAQMQRQLASEKAKEKKTPSAATPR